MEDNGLEERQSSGCCFMGALRSLVATVRDSIRRRRVRQRQKNYRIAKMHVEEEEAGAEKPKGTKRKKWFNDRFRRRPKDRQAAAAAKTAPKSSPEKATKAPQATEAIEEKEEVVPEAPAGAAGLQDDEASPTATDHDADDADHADHADDADHADYAADDEGDVQLKVKIAHSPGKGVGQRLTAVSKCADLSPRNYDDDGDAKSAEEARRCCEDVVQSTLLDQRADCCNTMPPSSYDYLMGYDTPEGLTTLRHIMETDESEAWDLFVLLSLTVTLGIITFYFFVSLFKIITEDV